MSTDQSNPTRALATFIGVGGAGGGRTIPIHTPVARIGQSARSDVVLDDDTVSSNHARLEYVDGAWQLTDLSSKNGTFVNGERIAPEVPIALADSDRVAFGALSLSFASSGEIVADEAARTYIPPSPQVARPARSGFRLPVWVLLLIVLIIAIILAVVVLAGGDPTPVDPTQLPAAAFIAQAGPPRAA